MLFCGQNLKIYMTDFFSAEKNNYLLVIADAGQITNNAACLYLKSHSEPAI